MARVPTRKVKKEDTPLSSFLGSTSSLIKSENEENLPLFIQFQFNQNNSIETDEAEVILSYTDGFAVPASAEDLPGEWRMTEPDPEGNAIFKIPLDACVNYQHRKLRRRRYHNNVRCRQMAA